MGDIDVWRTTEKLHREELLFWIIPFGLLDTIEAKQTVLSKMYIMYSAVDQVCYRSSILFV